MPTKQEIRSRLSALKDPRGVIQACALDISNYALEFDRIVEQEDIARLELFETQQQFLNSLEQSREATKQAKEYLKSTDWYIIREMDSGTPCPEDVKLARASARLQIQS